MVWTPPSLDYAQRLPSYAAITIRECRSLRVLHSVYDTVDRGDFETFNRLEAIADLGQIYSYHYGDDELIHAHIPLDFFQATRSIKASLGGPPKLLYSGAAAYQTAGWTEFEDDTGSDFYQFCPVNWQHFSDFRSLTVPLEVMENMRQAQGVSEEEWKQRGVALSDAAWFILMEWYDVVSLGVSTG